jgi:hypothetical protein
MALAPVPVPEGVTVHQLPIPDTGNVGRTDFSTSGKLLDAAHALATRYLTRVDPRPRALVA